MANILLLEPDKVMSRQYVRALTSAGHACFKVASAANALPIFDEQSIDVIVMELQLGRHNGLEFLYEIRTYGDLSQIPVIILSSVDPQFVQRAVAYEFLNISDYLYKPTTKLARVVSVVNDCAGVSVSQSKS